VSDLSSPVVLTAVGRVALGPGAPDQGCDPSPWLKVPKSRKYLGRQDELAVTAAGRALVAAGLRPEALGPRAGLYLSIAWLGFELGDIVPVLEASMEEGRFDLGRFTRQGMRKAHPLLTFRCLPNMPAYHVSANFNIQGSYLTTYPGAGQFHQCLEEASVALESTELDVALVGAVAFQRNFLTAWQLARVCPGADPALAWDAAVVLVLEREEHCRARGARPLARPGPSAVSYAPFDPDEGFPKLEPTQSARLGAASEAWRIADLLGYAPGVYALQATTVDGFAVTSSWEVLP
jgi:3-oxoacyl-(acyl-carrier-protein) synthase